MIDIMPGIRERSGLLLEVAYLIDSQAFVEGDYKFTDEQFSIEYSDKQKYKQSEAIIKAIDILKLIAKTDIDIKKYLEDELTDQWKVNLPNIDEDVLRRMVKENLK